MKRQEHRKPILPATTLAAAVGLACLPVDAQEPQPGQVVVLEEVLVTAQKREQTLQDVPNSVAALSAAMLEQTATTNFGDLSKITSGINVTGGQDGFGGVIRIRGVGTNAFVPAIRPAVGIFVDEVPLVDTASAYNNLADIERIEILKGPQSTLFGKEVSSGAIVMTTKRPDPTEMGGYIEGNFGNLGLAEYRLGGNLPLGDMFALRASVYHNERDGTIDNLVTGDEMGDYEKDGVRARLLFEPNDDFSAIFTYEYHDTEFEGSTSIAQQYGNLYDAAEELRNPDGPTLLEVLDPFDRDNKNSNPSDRDTETENFYLNLEWAFADSWTLNSVTSDQSFERQGKGQFPTPDGFKTADTSFGPYYLNDFINNPDNDSFTQELRVTFDGEKLSSIVGVFYADSDLVSYTPFGQMLGIIPAFGLEIKSAGESIIEEDVDELALFNHNIYSVTDTLDFIFGIRVSDVEKKSIKAQLVGTGPLASLNSPLVPTTPWADNIPEQDDSWDDVTGTLKVNWYLTDSVSVYAGWSSGFKAGGHNVVKSNPDGTPLLVPPFDSETADNYEIGFKSRLFGGSLSWNGAVFYQTYDDYQVDIADEVGIGNRVQNAASVEIEGVETDFRWLATERLLIDGSVSYVDARWDEYEDAECIRPQYQRERCDPDTLTQDLSGKRLNYTSPWTVNFNATYTFTLQNGMQIDLRGEYAYRDDMYFLPDNDPEVVADDYDLVNASIALRSASGNWDVLLWGKNLFDEDYIESAANNRDDGNPAFPGPLPVEGYRVGVGLETTYGITLKYRLGSG